MEPVQRQTQGNIDIVNFNSKSVQQNCMCLHKNVQHEVCV